jgi:hypothetical protein
MSPPMHPGTSLFASLVKQNSPSAQSSSSSQSPSQRPSGNSSSGGSPPGSAGWDTKTPSGLAGVEVGSKEMEGFGDGCVVVGLALI